MAEPAIHFSVPFAILSYAGFDLTPCLLASAIALLPDFDVLFRVHRSITHSFLLYVPIAILGALVRAIDPSVSSLMLVIWLSLSSHPLLDLIGGYSPALWPLLKQEISLSIVFNVRFGRSFQFEPILKVLRRPLELKPFDSLEAAALTGEGILISILLLALSMARLFL
mgnify:CR=1 FL=1